MRLVRLSLVSAVFAFSADAMAADGPSGREAAGVGTGVVIGAVAGGPAGAILGAAFGAKLGDTMHRQEEEVRTVSGSLDISRRELAQLQQDVVTLSADKDSLVDDLEKLRATAQPELLGLLAAGIEMDLLFRTDEHVLSSGTHERIQALASTLEPLQSVRVRLDGFADERGDADYNKELSLKRAESVRDLLVAGGIPAERIEVKAHGESAATDTNIDSYALERKVSLTLFVDPANSFAAASGQTH